MPILPEGVVLGLEQPPMASAASNAGTIVKKIIFFIVFAPRFEMPTYHGGLRFYVRMPAPQVPSPSDNDTNDSAPG
jgi:hypothetical protein